jgi:hypothetical protein
MTVRLSTTIRNIKTVTNPENVETILGFFEFMKKIGYSLKLRSDFVIRTNLQVKTEIQVLIIII